MKSKLFMYVLACVIGASLVAQENVKGLVFESLIYDYGKMKKNADGKCVFKFTNKSAAPIVITNVKTSCGCTSPRWPKKPILPAASNQIVIKYNTKLVGPFTKTITISTSAGQSILLTIKGEVSKE